VRNTSLVCLIVFIKFSMIVFDRRDEEDREKKKGN